MLERQLKSFLFQRTGSTGNNTAVVGTQHQRGQPNGCTQDGLTGSFRDADSEGRQQPEHGDGGCRDEGPGDECQDHRELVPPARQLWVHPAKVYVPLEQDGYAG